MAQGLEQLIGNAEAKAVYKSLDDFDYVFQTTISKREVNGLLDFGFIDNRENVGFIGSPGVGKTRRSSIENDCFILRFQTGISAKLHPTC